MQANKHQHHTQQQQQNGSDDDVTNNSTNQYLTMLVEEVEYAEQQVCMHQSSYNVDCQT